MHSFTIVFPLFPRLVSTHLSSVINPSQLSYDLDSLGVSIEQYTNTFQVAMNFHMRIYSDAVSYLNKEIIGSVVPFLATILKHGPEPWRAVSFPMASTWTSWYLFKIDSRVKERATHPIDRITLILFAQGTCRFMTGELKFHEPADLPVGYAPSNLTFLITNSVLDFHLNIAA